MKISIRIFFLLFVLLSHSLFAQEERRPKNIILLIGDGMGLNYVSASILSFDDNPFKKFKSIGFSVTCSADNLITDSAAGATAIATGYRTNNHYISVDPDNNPLKTIFEFAEEKQMSTGLVVTSSVTHATPASFVSHVIDRSFEDQIAKQMLDLDFDVVIGGGLRFFLPESRGGVQNDGVNLISKIKEKGYDFFNESEKLLNKKTDRNFYALLDNNGLKPASQRDYSLGELTSVAIDHLSKNENGFILMIEGSQIDWAAHDHETERALFELKDFNSAITAALSFAEKDSNTLVIITADHETGGMAITGGDDDGENLEFSYASDGHTAEMVGVFAKGPGEEKFRGVYNNNLIGGNLFYLLENNYSFD